jgi:hypothetical protein
VRSGASDALAEVAEHHPGGRPAGTVATVFTLSAAQLVVARRYGFPSWARLRRYVDVLERYSRFPARMAAEGPADPADDFLRLACLRYEDDQPERWAQAHQILAEHPEITQASIYVAAATADLARLEAFLAADPGAAGRPGGPYRWEPLFYLTYARHDPQIGQAAVLGAARLLLQAGADPNDGQALYNRMFEPGNDHLELLLEFGLGTGDGGPWKARMGDALDTPEQMVRGDLRWAITHGMADRVRLFVAHGVDIVSPFGDGVTPAERAATTGHPDLVRYLIAHGAAEPDLRPGQKFAAAALVTDHAAVAELRAAHPGLAEAVARRRPSLIVWAAAHGQPGSVELLAGLGFDVNAMGRSDAPASDPWQNALHVAAMEGNLGLAQSLLRLGADPDIRDQRFNSTPLGWARYFSQRQLIELLEPLTAPEDRADE